MTNKNIKQEQPKSQPSPGKDIVIDTLKKKYFELSLKENYPNTLDITKELDNLEKAIKELEDKNKELVASI